MSWTPKTAAAIGLLLAGVAEVPNFYSGMLPSLWTIGHFGQAQSGEARYWIVRGLVISGVLTVTTGFGISLLAKTWAPLVGMSAMAGVLTYFYLHALYNGSGAGWEGGGQKAA